MSNLPKDHIYVILVAFLAVLACFTTVALVGTDPANVTTLRDVLFALGGSLGTAYVAGRRQSSIPNPEDENVPSS